MHQHGSRLWLPHLNHRRWSFGLGQWLSKRFYVSLFASRPSRSNSDGLDSYKSHGSIHKQLTFSEFLGQPYDTEVSQKFVEYLQLCLRTSHPVLLVDFH